MTSLKLFNAVLADPNADATLDTDIVSTTLPFGYVITPSAQHLAAEIMAYYEAEQLDGKQLNQTFFHNWERIQTMPDHERTFHQALHYLTTYGLQAYGADHPDLIYLPREAVDVPALTKTPIRLIQGLSADAMAEKALDLLRSGVALAEETLHDIFDLLAQIDRVPTTTAGIRNREALVLFAELHGVYPEHPADFLRYLVFVSTGKTLLIKNEETIKAIKESHLPISEFVEAYGLERCAEVFNRFKPLWLAFKALPANVRVINRIGKLSKRHHVPLPVDYLNTVTAQDEVDLDELEQALQRANAFRKIRLLYALRTRLTDTASLVYRIRNGKTYTVARPRIPPHRPTRRKWQEAYDVVYWSIVGGLDVAGQTILVDEHIRLALPATEKQFVGNFPAGTQVVSSGALTVGIYWENAWGARDLDLSSLALSGKVGWNASANRGGVTYSGDITDASNGATELLRFSTKVRQPHLVNVNVYSGAQETAFKIIVGRSKTVKPNYLFHPDELLLETKVTSTQRQQALGFVATRGGEVTFTLINGAAGSRRVSVNGNQLREALYYQWTDAPRLAQVLSDAGATVTTDAEVEADLDLRGERLTKDLVLGLFG